LTEVDVAKGAVGIGLVIATPIAIKAAVVGVVAAVASLPVAVVASSAIAFGGGVSLALRKHIDHITGLFDTSIPFFVVDY
jgi:hypothetical protein